MPSAISFSPRTRGCLRRAPVPGGRVELLPAHAGVSPFTRSVIATSECFSPRTRGCLHQRGGSVTMAGLLPAHAGVSPYREHETGLGRLLRARGALLSWGIPLDTAAPNFSPRTRGCLQHRGQHQRRPSRLPAHAGVSPWRTTWHYSWTSSPRARGGVSIVQKNWTAFVFFSPRTRGCLRDLGGRTAGPDASPAHAGVSPTSNGPLTGGANFSPRTRGCLLHGGAARTEHRLLPAHAGVSPTWTTSRPRRRSSPRRRGCLLALVPLVEDRVLLPAHASLQAFIFVLLSTIYLGGAVATEHETRT